MKLQKPIKYHYFVVPGLAMVFGLGLAINAYAVPRTQCKVVSSKGSVAVDLNNLANCMEKRYGFDKDTLRRSQQKESAPEVTIFFDRTDPKEGEKITATAVPTMFKNVPEDLYFTWYIIHTDADGNPKDTDDDGDLSDEIENGKREAMGRAARGSFDPILFGISRDRYEDTGDDDNDGFIAPYGGIDGMGAKKLDSDSSSGDNDDIDSDEDNCDDDYNPDQSDVDKDEKGDVCDSDIDNDDDLNDDDNCPFNINSDQADTDDDGLGDICDEKVGENDKDNDGIDDDNDNCPEDKNSDQANEDGDVFGDKCDDDNNLTEGGSCKVNVYEDMSETGVVNSNCITRCYRHNFGVKSDIIEVEAGADEDSGRDMVVSCQHAFPVSDPDTQKINYADGELDCEEGYTIGDGSFNNQEEACWRLDPGNPDTDGDGIEDEKDLAGLNQQSFTWNYKKGDRVGVIIEGTSVIPTNEDVGNSYFKIMWAMPGLCSSIERDYLAEDQCDSRSDYGFNYNATVEVNLKAEENLQTTLVNNPTYPQYDFYEPENSDSITVSANVTNEVADERYVYYDWSIYRCGSSDFEQCVTTEVYDKTYIDANPRMNILLTKNCKAGTNQDLADCAVETSGPLRGMGLNEVTFQPKKEIMRLSKEYFKVILKTKRKESDTRYSVTDIIIPVTQNDIDINLYNVVKKEDGSYSLGDKICDQGIYTKMCPVYPNQTIAAKANPRFQEGDKFVIESYAWQLDNQTLFPPLVCSFDKCDMNDTVYIPITGNELSLGSISVTAKRKNGEDLIAQRVYSVNNPLARIFIDDIEQAWPFEKFDNTEAEDIFETYQGNTVTLRADLIPDYLTYDANTQLIWYINGEEVDSATASSKGITLSGNKISFPVNISVGSSINVSASVEKMFSESEKVLLANSWGILDPRDQRSDTSVEIKVVYKQENINLEDETASLKLFLASTVQNAPQVFLFTLRLAVGLVLITTIFSAINASFRFKE